MLDLGQPHHLTLDNAIKWLENLRNQCDGEIQRLRMLQVHRAEAKRRREFIRNFVNELISKNLDSAEAIRRLRNMGYPETAIAEAAKIWRNVARRRVREMRNQEILRRVLLNHESPTDLAAEYGISRMQVHRIIGRKEKPAE